MIEVRLVHVKSRRCGSMSGGRPANGRARSSQWVVAAQCASQTIADNVNEERTGGTSQCFAHAGRLTLVFEVCGVSSSNDLVNYAV